MYFLVYIFFALLFLIIFLTTLTQCLSLESAEPDPNSLVAARLRRAARRETVLAAEMAHKQRELAVMRETLQAHKKKKSEWLLSHAQANPTASLADIGAADEQGVSVRMAPSLTDPAVPLASPRSPYRG